jgi:hypothetical protein
MTKTKNINNLSNNAARQSPGLSITSLILVSLGNNVGVTEPTIREWIALLPIVIAVRKALTRQGLNFPHLNH